MKAKHRATQARTTHNVLLKKRNYNSMARWRSNATPEQRGVMRTVQRKCMNRRNRMRREERVLVNHHTKKDEENSVNCINV